MDTTQRKALTVTHFHFSSETLKYTRHDIQGVHGFRVAYANIIMAPRIATERNAALLTGAVLLGAWGLVAAVHALALGDTLGIMYLIPGPLCALLYVWSSVTSTWLGTEEGDVGIIHGPQHDQIFTEIRDRRKKQLLDWYGTVDFANDPEDEIKKFSWLYYQHII